MPKRARLIEHDLVFHHPPRKSPVWRYFKVPIEPTEAWRDLAQCAVEDCNDVFSVKGGGTSTLRRHLRIAHNINFQTEGKGTSAEDQRELANSLAICLLRDRLPMSFVQNAGFREWMKKASPHFQVPHRTVIRQLVGGMCLVLKAELRRVMSTVKYLCITNDSWTSRAACSHLIVTGHWVNDNFIYNSCTLAIRPMYEKHTGQKICKTLKKILDDYGYNGIVVAKTHDNASNFVCANVNGDREGKQWLPGESIRCYAHSMNLAVKELLKHETLVALVNKCRVITKYFNKSTTASARLREEQKRLNIPHHKVLPDVRHRWNSTFITMQRLLELRNPVSQILQNHERAKVRRKQMKPEDWELLVEIVPILKPVFEATVIISGDQYPTLSLVLVLFYGMIAELRCIVESTRTDIVKELAQILIRELTSYTGDDQKTQLEWAAAALDPRTKDLQHLHHFRQKSVWAHVEMVTVAYHEKARTPILEQKAADSGGDLLSRMMTSSTREAAGATLQARVRKEIKAWKVEHALPIRDRVGEKWVYNCPFTYWRNIKHKYPLLAPIAQQVLAVKGSSVASERVGSVVGNIVSNRRARLSPEFVEDLALGALNWDFLNKVTDWASLSLDQQNGLVEEEPFFDEDF